MPKKIIIAIDGHAGAGKSSTARKVAQALNYIYVDSGAMYRAVTLYFQQHQISLDHPNAVQEALEALDITLSYNTDKQANDVLLDGEVVTDQLYTMPISKAVIKISAIPAVRERVMRLQHKLVVDKGIIMDGRDIGTKVFPNAELKIFMTADINKRAARRHADLLEKHDDLQVDEVEAQLSHRDQADESRTISPLVKAPDAIEIDTSHISLQEVVNKIVALAKEKIAQ